MKTAAVAFVAATATSVVATPVVRELALRRGALDLALSSRKVHGRPVPRLGGVAIVLAFYAAVAALWVLDDTAAQQLASRPVRVPAFLLGGAVIAALGIYDDLRGSGAKAKFLVQFAVAAGIYAAGLRIDTLSIPFLGGVHLGVLGFPLTLLWISGVINALNLIDGLDGLAGGVALIALVAMAAIGGAGGKVLTVLFAAALAGAVLGFLVYNFNPASIFMGDTGSMFLGFVLAAMAIPTSQKSTTAVALLVPIVALGIPIADTLLAMGRRAARGLPLFSADRGHIHHRLLARGLSQRQTVLFLYGVSVVLGLVAYALTRATPGQAAGTLLALAAAGGVGLWRLGFVNPAQAEELFEARRRNLATMSVIHRVGVTLRAAWSPEEVWGAVRSVAQALGASAAALRLEGADDEDLSFGFAGGGTDLFVARFGLGRERARSGDLLELGWADGREALDRDTEIAVERLCNHVGDALERVRPRRVAAEAATRAMGAP